MLFVLVYIFLDFRRDVRGFQPAAVSSSAAMVFSRSGAAFLGLVARVKNRGFYVVVGSAGGLGRKNRHLGGLSTEMVAHIANIAST